MYEKDLKKLTRQELLELLLEQSKRIDRLNIKITDLEEQLEKRDTAFKESGNLAEAALKVSGFFEAAQKAADYYMSQSAKQSGVGEIADDYAAKHQKDDSENDSTPKYDFELFSESGSSKEENNEKPKEKKDFLDFGFISKHINRSKSKSGKRGKKK